MKKIFDNPWMYRLIALIFAVLLFVYINNSQLGVETSNSDKEEVSQLATSEKTVSATLQIISDTDKYFITGYPEKVSVKLEGPTALVTSTANSQNFKVFIDLTKYKEGTQVVPVEISGLNNQITATLTPKNVTVKIQPRTTKSFPIQIVYNEDNIPSGYETKTATADPSVVNVTGPSSEINKIDHIEARLNVAKNTTDTIEREVMLQAVDADGRQLNVVLTPATTHVTLPIVLPSKTVDLKIKQTNADSNLKYTVTPDVTEVKLYGSQSVLDKIDSIEATIDLSGHTKSFSKNIDLKLPDKVIKIEPTTIKIQVDIANAKEESKSS